ncbi:hypothetical protein THAOC_23869 [Thalassiosira oceanica]|uniref:Uncharacterized protein n=1 Tax=Thalassiosira oceanica TaxID=159749 RepID=K0RR96_THAOC|nr:hypothetical protein THAOC_23869 [Thalassiosira oceanica]|eukprot:EJK56283.1 hypothetical protein THAOC_23869 [Thalassiosira oceanica]
MGRRQQAAAITLQRSARGLLARAIGRRHQAAAITLQRHARGITIRAKAGHPEDQNLREAVKARGGEDTFLHDDDWVHEVPEDIPPIPTTPQGEVIFTRLTLDQVDLVPHKDLAGIITPSDYSDKTVAKAEKEARRSLMARYYERQLNADRILTLYGRYNLNLAIDCSVASYPHIGPPAPMDCAQFLLSGDEQNMARARGFTRSWYQMWDKETRLVSFTLDAKRALEKVEKDKRALEEGDALPLIGEAHDDDWVIVDRNTDIPALPTNPRGSIVFTRLDLGQVELVSFDNWRDFLWTFEYGKDDATNATANKNARRTLLTRYLDRQLQADRILTQSNWFYRRLRPGTDLAPFDATREEKQLARDRGLTRLWDWD